jgi:hypothetical protein
MGSRCAPPQGVVDGRAGEKGGVGFVVAGLGARGEVGVSGLFPFGDDPLVEGLVAGTVVVASVAKVDNVEAELEKEREGAHGKGKGKRQH